MKTLAIDSSSDCLAVAAKNEGLRATCLIDAGTRQSELLIGAMDFALGEVGIKAGDLDCAAVCSGPGSFTSLRLAFSAVKALSMAHGIPVHAIPTLEVLAAPYMKIPMAVVPAVDAKKGRFFCAVYKDGEEAAAAREVSPEELPALIGKADGVLVCGPAASALARKLKFDDGRTVAAMESRSVTTDALIEMAEARAKSGREPLKDFDGPVYIRASAAEENALQ